MNALCKAMFNVVIAVLCVAAFGLATSAPVHAGAGGAHVYLMRGIFNVSEGMDVLAARLNRMGIRASVYGHTEYSAIASAAQSAYASGAERTIVLIGHSLGATAAVEAARELSQAHVPVALVVTIDPVSTAVMPGNVRRAVNFYVGRGMGQKVQPDAGFHGSLNNVDFSGDPNMGHMEIQRSAAVHDRIVNMVLGAVGARHAASAPRPPS